MNGKHLDCFYVAFNISDKYGNETKINQQNKNCMVGEENTIPNIHP